ncbi:MAG: hypothetical protein IPK74_14805 [Deltaproteobacteria bacterium]|nr:hypothetical protein [Deltaproteobacteria bacterium]
MRVAAGLLLSWVACGGAAPPRAPAATREPEPAAGMPAPVRAPPACEGAQGLVVVQSRPIEARWNRHLVRGGEGEIEVHWCGDGAIELRELSLESSRGARWIRAYDPGMMPVRSGGAVTLRARGLPGAGGQPATLVAIDDGGRELRVEFTVVSIDDPARTAAIAACDACHGTWGTVGMAATETCDCPTADAGRRCSAAADCESFCIATGWEPSASADDPGRCAPGERRERLVGRCHGRQHAFGCRARLTEVRERCVGEGVAPADRLPVVCAD